VCVSFFNSYITFFLFIILYFVMLVIALFIVHSFNLCITSYQNSRRSLDLKVRSMHVVALRRTIPADVLALVPLRVMQGRGFREIREFLFNCGRTKVSDCERLRKRSAGGNKRLAVRTLRRVGGTSFI